MLLVFWVLWRLRWLNARETFAAVRLPITGAVRRFAAVMAFYLRSFEANKLNTNRRLRAVDFCSDGAAPLDASRDSVLPDAKHRGGLDGLAACKDTSKLKLAFAAALKQPRRASPVPQ